MAVVVQTSSSSFAAAVTGAVNYPLPQTSGVAELFALVAVHQIADESSHRDRSIHTDYQTSVNLSSGLPRAALLHHKRAYSGMLRDLQATRTFGTVPVHKVKAHTNGTSIEERGNEEADQQCKDFAASWSCISFSSEQDHRLRSNMAARVAKLAALALPLFPSLRQLAEQVGLKRFTRLPREARAPRAPPQPPALPVTPHILIDTPLSGSGAVRCCVCSAFFRHRYAAAARSECSQKHPIFHQPLNGHDIRIVFVQRGTVEGECFSICVRCGHTSVRNALPGPCAPPAVLPKGPSDRIAAFSKGLHPDHKRRAGATLSPPLKLAVIQEQAGISH